MKTLKIVSVAIVILGTTIGFVINSSSEGKAQTSKSTIATSYSVSVVKAARKDLTPTFSIVGTIVANNDVTVLSETQGRVLKVNAEVGDYKKAGSVLAEVDDELKKAAFEAAKATYEKAKKDLERYEALYKENSVSDSQIEQARWSYQTAESQYIVARRQFNDTKITTPISGIVTARYIDVGSTVQGAPQASRIVDIVDISKLKVDVNVAEKDVFKLHVGDKVAVSTDVFPNETFTGTINTISVKGDNAHTYPVEVILDNSKQELKAGMFGTVTFTEPSTSKSIFIPREAIVGSLRDGKLYVVQNNMATLRTVTVGREIGTQVEVVNGLTEGETVVVNGQNNLDNNTPVIVRN